MRTLRYAATPLLFCLAGFAACAEDLSKGAALCRSRIEAELFSSPPIRVLEVSEEGWPQGLVSTDIVFDVTNSRGKIIRKTATCKIRTTADTAVRLEEFFMPLQRWEHLDGSVPGPPTVVPR